MSGGGKNGDYWPGFVDALTNVVIAMVFVIVVLAIALSFSAQLLAKRMAAKIAEQQAQIGRATVVAPGATTAEQKPRSGPPIDAGLPVRTLIAVAGNEQAPAASAAGVGVKSAERYLQLNYAPSALTLDSAAIEQLTKALLPLRQRLAAVASAKLSIVATGPELQLSENQRAAFIRAMVVRNQLLSEGIAPGRITTRIDVNTQAAAPGVALRIEESR
ncbi:hypothetical protein CLD22_15755 [Rubrivivax gelatinosus]|nr:hypothetical protein [Rubrivivax gelatinosus]